MTTDAGDLWTSWASLDKHHWTHLSRSDMASRSGIASRSDIVGRLDIQSVGSVFLLVLAAFGNVGSYIAKTPPEHTFLLHCASGGQTINTAAPDI